jgi:TolA-binding protein
MRTLKTIFIFSLTTRMVTGVSLGLAASLSATSRAQAPTNAASPNQTTPNQQSSKSTAKSSDADTSSPKDLVSAPEASDPHFHEKLTLMLDHTEKSIKLLREQITQNQSAPFLANLYMQLGDLLSEKSNVLYYLQMEHDKNTDLKVKETRHFSPVVQAQQDAIAIYQQILADFPKFDKTDQVLYRLAISQKSIDEGAAFAATAEKLIKAFPKTKEAMQAHLLLGQYFFDQQDYERALVDFNVVKDSAEPFERNSARYRIGLIEIAQEKHAAALKHFEQVATDDELKAEDNPAEMSLKTKSVKNNIKREALTDSVRAYTEVYKTDPDPVAYYSRIAPTEALFQEAIEKLAYRYIFLKQYNFAIKLLRTLSERTADSQKIMNIYHEVLMLIPLEDRIKIPVAEIQFVMEKYNYWATHYAMTAALRKKAAEFFETQLRELGTHSHDLAKKEKDKIHKEDLYARAQAFYLLYLGFFHRGIQSVKIATNLADVYFNESNYLVSGSYYLRVYSGEFGPPTEKVALIQNAILSLQKPSEYAFYEQLRAKGLLVKAILTYQAFDPKKKEDPELNFALAKTYYEQGFYLRSLEMLYGFMKKYPGSSDVSGAAELILNYFNIRSDFKGLVDWSQKMLALNPKSPELQKRLAEVHSKALLKRLDEQVKSQKGYDVFSQGKSYLQTALLSGNSGLRSAAFEQALVRSKAEKDIGTFLATAGLMAKTAETPQKRADLLNSMADETFAIGRFYQTLKTWRQIFADPAQTPAAKSLVFEQMVKLTIMMRDFPTLSGLLANSASSHLSPETKKAALHEIESALDSPLEMPKALYQWAAGAGNEDTSLALFKAQFKMPSPIRAQIIGQIAATCKSPSTTLCKWSNLSQVLDDVNRFSQVAKTSPADLKSVEGVASQMNGLNDQLKSYQGTSDPQLDILLTLAQAKIYDNFSDFLGRVAQANKEVATILNGKSQESQQSAQKSRAQCQTIVTAAKLISPTNRACQTGQLPTLQAALAWPGVSRPRYETNDPQSPDIEEVTKKIFVERKDWKPYFDLAEIYLAKGDLQHASAVSLYASSAFTEDQEQFNAILGCVTQKMGLANEARFYLSKASDLNDHKKECGPK